MKNNNSEVTNKMWLVTNVSQMTQVTSINNKVRKVAWKQHYERLLNEEFS